MIRTACTVMIALAVLFPARAQFEPGMTVTGFRVPRYNEDGQLEAILFGDRATAVSDHLVDITNLRIETLSGDEVDMRATAPICRFDQRSGVATSESDIRITRNNVVITGQGFRWDAATARFEIHRNARVVIRGRRSALDRREE